MVMIVIMIIVILLLIMVWHLCPTTQTGGGRTLPAASGRFQVHRDTSNDQPTSSEAECRVRSWCAEKRTEERVRKGVGLAALVGSAPSLARGPDQLARSSTPPSPLPVPYLGAAPACSAASTTRFRRSALSAWVKTASRASARARVRARASSRQLRLARVRASGRAGMHARSRSCVSAHLLREGVCTETCAHPELRSAQACEYVCVCTCPCTCVCFAAYGLADCEYQYTRIFMDMTNARM